MAIKSSRYRATLFPPWCARIGSDSRLGKIILCGEVFSYQSSKFLYIEAFRAVKQAGVTQCRLGKLRHIGIVRVVGDTRVGLCHVKDLRTHDAFKSNGGFLNAACHGAVIVDRTKTGLLVIVTADAVAAIQMWMTLSMLAAFAACLAGKFHLVDLIDLGRLFSTMAIGGLQMPISSFPYRSITAAPNERNLFHFRVIHDAGASAHAPCDGCRQK